MKYNYDEFKKYVMENIGSYLPKEYEDARMEFQQIRKSGGNNYEALMIKPNDGETVCAIPALNLTEAFSRYEQGEEPDNIVSDLAEIRTHAKLPDEELGKKITDFEYARSKIFPRLVNTATNAEYLADKPHVEVEDLSLMYALRIQEDSNGMADAIIDDKLIEIWGIDESELKDIAMENMSTREPFFANIEEVIFSKEVTPIPGEMFSHIEELDPSDYSLPFFVLSNQQKTKGAVMALEPKTMSLITEKLGDVYIIPSSVDEVIVVPKSVIDDVAHLSDMVKQVNAETVAPQDQLSNNVYEYDPDNQTLVVASAPQQGEVQTM